MSIEVDENRLLAAITQLELSLSKQITTEVRGLEQKLEDKVSKQEFELLREHVTQLREHGSSQATLALTKAEKVNGRVDRLEGWRNRILGMGALVVFLEPILVVGAIHFIH